MNVQKLKFWAMADFLEDERSVINVFTVAASFEDERSKI
jgi:hypothetical protein